MVMIPWMMRNKLIQICNLGPDATVHDWIADDPSVCVCVCVPVHACVCMIACVCINKPCGELGLGASLVLEENLLIVTDWGIAQQSILEQLLSH